MHLASVGRNGKRLFKGKEDKTVKEIQIQLPIAALNDWLEGQGEGVSWLSYDGHLKLSSIHAVSMRQCGFPMARSTLTGAQGDGE